MEKAVRKLLWNEVCGQVSYLEIGLEIIRIQNNGKTQHNSLC